MGYALHLDAHPQPRIAVEGLTFEVAAGGMFTVLGPSGSGKSTLLRCLDRLVEPSAGRVLVDGRDASGLPVQELRRRVGMVFQTAALFDGSVLDNVLYGPRLRGPAAGDARSAGDSDAACSQAEGLLRRVGLPRAIAGSRSAVVLVLFTVQWRARRRGRSGALLRNAGGSVDLLTSGAAARNAGSRGQPGPSLPGRLRMGKMRTRAAISSIVMIAPLSRASACSSSTRTTCAPSASGKTSCVRT